MCVCLRVRLCGCVLHICIRFYSAQKLLCYNWYMISKDQKKHLNNYKNRCNKNGKLRMQ